MLVVMMLVLVIVAAALTVLIVVVMVLMLVVVATALAVLIVVVMVLMLVVMAAALAVLIVVVMMLMIMVVAAALAIFLMLTVEVSSLSELSKDFAYEGHNALFNFVEINTENYIGSANLYSAGSKGAFLTALYFYGCANGGNHDRFILVPGNKTLVVADENIILVGPAVGFFHSGNHCGDKLIRAVCSGKLHIKISGNNSSLIVKSCAYVYMYHFNHSSLYVLL